MALQVNKTYFGMWLLILPSIVFCACPENKNACEWISWGAFEDCTRTCGGGTSYRTRSLCCPADEEYYECAENCNLDPDGSRDTKSCNTICTNGAYVDGECDCGDAYYGYCCQHEITCGRPSTISNGGFTGSNYDYDDVIEYYCNDKYSLIDGDEIHTCSKRYSGSTTGYWDGDVPSCAFVASCESNPCQNGATCTNQPNAYTCSCVSGWSGKNCEFDIQPPLYDNCQDDVEYHTELLELQVTWPTPSFWDPLGNDVFVTSNYQDSIALLPWGRHTVQYIADKPSNGLRSECKFTISIYPYPCTELRPPLNGAFACNDWNDEFTEVCTLFCQAGYDVPLGVDISTLFICGASGNWLPFNTTVGCAETQDFKDDDHYFVNSCSGSATAEEIKKAYIKLLKESDMSSLCNAFEWESGCTTSNVKLIC